MYIYIQIYISKHVYFCQCLYIYMYVCMHKYCVCSYSRTPIYMYIRMYVCLYTYVMQDFYIPGCIDNCWNLEKQLDVPRSAMLISILSTPPSQSVSQSVCLSVCLPPALSLSPSLSLFLSHTLTRANAIRRTVDMSRRLRIRSVLVRQT